MCAHLGSTRLSAGLLAMEHECMPALAQLAALISSAIHHIRVTHASWVAAVHDDLAATLATL